MKTIVSLVALSLISIVPPSFGSNESIRSAPIPEIQVLVESSKPPKCTRTFFSKDCTARKAYKRIGRLSDTDVQGITKEYRRFFMPLFAICYQTANFNKSSWRTNCGFTQERLFIEALFSEPAVIGQGSPVASSIRCIPFYKEALQEAVYSAEIRKNAVLGINRFLAVMETASYLEAARSLPVGNNVISDVVDIGIKNRLYGEAHEILIKIATNRSNWNRVKRINERSPLECS